MRQLPEELLKKLEGTLKAESNHAEEHLRIIATQLARNTLLSEPIHEEIPAAYGDVAVRQMEGEDNISMAFAICLDNQTANIYERKLPASMEQPWNYLWSLGKALDVAIEYQGTWELSATREWYYLQTEEYPYVFWVDENKSLYVQHWKDATTRVELDTDVDQISVCKGWNSRFFPDQDQGLLLGYLKAGTVYYRALCCQSNGTFLWESAQEVAGIQKNSSFLSVFRTNDFRIGFLTEANQNLQCILSKRNYAGMSIRPECVNAQIQHVTFAYQTIKDLLVPFREQVVCQGMSYLYFNHHPANVDELKVIRTEKLNLESEFSSFGFALYLNKPITSEIEPDYKSFVTITPARAINEVVYDAENKALRVMVASPITRATPVTISIAAKRTMYYEIYDKQVAPIPALSGSVTAETRTIHRYVEERISATYLSATTIYEDMVKRPVFSNEAVITSITNLVLVFVPASNLPI